ncbi:MAG: 4'-phosphopantetheinyl transferase superfamily protein [Pseudomonadales bacterium]|jgi:4'-phosphopantetheinyl transferase|nr:4'-phosphopantetheinyl transferase superfamily protein [Pseudomonadales bacterium]
MSHDYFTKAIHLWWASPSAAAAYSAQALSPADRPRAQRPRGAKAELDWRVSRALLARAAPGACSLSLSHSAGHALCGQTGPGIRLGVDLERLQARDVTKLAAWVCDAGEREALARLSHAPERQLEFFYVLWTLKEAFIKAAGLDFPADMRGAGLSLAENREPALRPPAGKWHARVFWLAPHWMAAAVWSGGETTQTASVIWHPGPASPLPDYRLLGSWDCA